MQEGREGGRRGQKTHEGRVNASVGFWYWKSGLQELGWKETMWQTSDSGGRMDILFNKYIVRMSNKRGCGCLSNSMLWLGGLRRKTGVTYAERGG